MILSIEKKNYSIGHYIEDKEIESEFELHYKIGDFTNDSIWNQKRHIDILLESVS